MISIDRKTEPIFGRSIRIALLLSVLIFAIQVILVADDKPVILEARDTGKCFLWKVTSPTSTAYLRGALGFSTSQQNIIDKAFLLAFANSDVLVLEMIPKTISLDSDDVKIPAYEKLKPKTQRLLKVLDNDVFMNKHMSDFFKHDFPLWSLAVRVPRYSLKMGGYENNSDFGDLFYHKARSAKKQVVELEGEEQMLKRLRSLTDDEQELLVRKALMDARGIDTQTEEIILAVEWGDADYVQYAFEAPLREDPELELIYKNYYYAKCGKLAAQISGYLQGKQNVFAVFDPVLMVGEKGIVEQLKKNPDFKVEQVERQGYLNRWKGLRK